MGLWSRSVRISGWLCAFGSALILINLILVLFWAPEEWRPGSGWETAELGDLLHADLLIGWFGWWGYAGHLIWVPIALAKGWQAWC